MGLLYLEKFEPVGEFYKCVGKNKCRHHINGVVYVLYKYQRSYDNSGQQSKLLVSFPLQAQIKHKYIRSVAREEKVLGYK